MTRSSLWLSVLLCATLCACGGDSGSSSSDAPEPPSQDEQDQDNQDQDNQDQGDQSPSEPEPDEPSPEEPDNPDDQANCDLPELPSIANSEVLAELGQPASYDLSSYTERGGNSVAGVWLAVHRVDAITDLGQRGREVTQVWHSSTLQVREQNGGYQIANCGLDGGWQDWPTQQTEFDLPLFVGAGQHPQFRQASISQLEGISLPPLSADEGPQRRPVNFINQQTRMIRLGDVLPSLGQVEQQINQLNLNQPVQCFTRRLERSYSQGCGQQAELQLHSLSLVASGEQGSATLSASVADSGYIVVNTVTQGTNSRNGLTASQPDITAPSITPLNASAATHYQGTNLNDGKSSVSLTLNIDVPL
ncbi:hypothetical protein GCM10011297_29960 [Bacterioplanes sanyensis]|uniref:hypothetical protein n=1 Tax=Bacterioplanes sanyensis TaxID=1249553 RepID=UPI0016738C7E|nr:hypothetical protein [Bacterioplanes sanyensis]GGY55083.1 hypothetical protein GCM10011297_29960 [Bacterioplanes sanyensis]